MLLIDPEAKGLIARGEPSAKLEICDPNLLLRVRRIMFADVDVATIFHNKLFTKGMCFGAYKISQTLFDDGSSDGFAGLNL